MNIPTDLLRTLVAIVDLRSFTKAAHSLGVTQPAVSAQIKRLQQMLGAELLDKSAPGITLTPRGDTVVDYARRLLSINDQILHLTATGAAAQTLRIGFPSDFVGRGIPQLLADFRATYQDTRFDICGGRTENLLHQLKQGELDIAVGAAVMEPAQDAVEGWTEDAVWVRSIHTTFDPDGVVPLVTRGDDCPYHRTAVGALYHAGRDCEFVVTAETLAAVQSAVTVGFGTTVVLRGMMQHAGAKGRWPELSIWDDGPLPKLPKLFCGVYLRDGSTKPIEDLALNIARVLRPAPQRDEAEPRPASTAASASRLAG